MTWKVIADKSVQSFLLLFATLTKEKTEITSGVTSNFPMSNFCFCTADTNNRTDTRLNRKAFYKQISTYIFV